VSHTVASPAPPRADPRGLPSEVAGSPPVTAGEACPLCDSPLQREQEWCLRCGAAARTRLAATPNWRAPVAAVAVLTALSLGVLAAALVHLAGGSGSAKPTTTTIGATAPATLTPTPTGQVPPAAGTPGTTTPGASTAPATTTPGASTTLATTTPAATTPAGAGVPGVGGTSILPGVTMPGSARVRPGR
jgi:hypothetical protein